MTKNTLVVLTKDQMDFKTKLTDLDLPGLEIIVPEDPDEAEEAVAKATILLASPSKAKKYINGAKNVLWVQSTFAGIDVLTEPDLRKDYILTNVRDVYGEAMSEYVFSYILFFEKEILENLTYQTQGVWNQKKSNVLKDKTICILGTGSIGQAIAKTAKTFNMRSVGYRTKNEPSDFFDEVFFGDSLKNCLSQADYIVSVLPKTKDTDNFINKQTLSYMKPEAVFINIGRGNAVNEQDLIEAVKQKNISKAVLDVFKEEPLPKQSPLWSTTNIYLTPHISGYILSDKLFEIFAENYKRFIKSQELLYKINFAKGY